MTPDGRAGEVRPVARAVPGVRGAARRPERQPAERAGPGREDRDQAHPAVRRRGRAHRRGRRGQGQGRRQPAGARRRRAAQPPAHRARAGRAARGRAARPAAGPVGPRRGPQGLRRPAVPGAAGAALRDAVLGRAGGRAGLRGGRPGARAGRGPARSWPGCRRVCGSALHVRGTWARGTGDATGLGLACQSAPEGEPRGDDAAYLDLAALDADDEQALAAWLADPGVPKALHDAKGPLLALWRTRARPGRRDQRHRARGLPGAARSGRVRPRRPGAALPAPRAAGRVRRPGRRPADPGRRGGGRGRPGRGGRRPAGPGGRRPGGRAGPGPGAARRHALLRDVELPLVRVLAAVRADRDRRRRRAPRRAGVPAAASW